jgi:hypothetical protein
MIGWPMQNQCDAFYGNPRGRNGQASRAWESANLVTISPPWPLFYAGKPAKLRVHKKCADAFRLWFEAVWTNAGKDARVVHGWGMAATGGAYNFRLMRGGSALSMHSWGCAVDMDAPRNGFHNRRPHFASLRKEVVDPFLKLGGVWGGDWNGNRDSLDERACDGMHFQFARLA